MSIKTDAIVIRDETATGANTATRVGTNLVDIADDLVAKQAAIDLNNAKVGITAQQASDITTNTAKVGVTTEEANPDVVSKVEAEAGTATTERIWTAERVKQAIVALGGSGSVDDTAYGISWDGVTGTAPSKNALYDFIESQVFKVDATSNIVPIFWGGTQAEYDIDFPTGHDPEYFIVITDGAVSPTNASDIVNAPSGNLVATDVQGALNEIQSELDGALTTTAINTLAKVNAVVADATLIDTADARLSDARTPTAHTHTASEVTDFDTEVANNTAVASNTAKVTNATHTGDVTGANALTIASTAISGKSTTVTLDGTEEVLLNNGGTLEKTTTQAIADLGGGGGAVPFIQWDGISATSNFRWYYVRTPDWYQESNFYQASSTNLPAFTVGGAIGLSVTEDKTITSIKGSLIGQASYNNNIYFVVKRIEPIATDLNITTATTTLTSTTHTFVVGDVGKTIWVVGAGTTGAVLTTTIASFTDANTVELTLAADTTVSNANGSVETNIELYVTPSLPIVAFSPYIIDITGISFNLQAGDRLFISNKGDSGSISSLNLKIELY
jgi:hypothetical protein